MKKKKVSQLSHRFELLLCLPRLDPFHISCLCPCQQPCQQTPEGWEKLRHRWAVHNIVYVPDSSFRCWKLVAHWQHTGDNLKNCFRNMDSLSERNQWRKCSVNQTAAFAAFSSACSKKLPFSGGIESSGFWVHLCHRVDPGLHWK